MSMGKRKDKRCSFYAHWNSQEFMLTIAQVKMGEIEEGSNVHQSSNLIGEN
jgi:hypothetical protein